MGENEFFSSLNGEGDVLFAVHCTASISLFMFLFIRLGVLAFVLNERFLCGVKTSGKEISRCCRRNIIFSLENMGKTEAKSDSL